MHTDQPNPTAARPSAAAPVDPIRILRRSLRCFVCGLLGVVPAFGLGLAAEAIRLHRQVVAETGEPWDPTRVRVYFCLGCVCEFFYGLMFENLFLLLPIALFGGLLAFLVWWQYATEQGRVWNGARQCLYWGLGLAYGGCFLAAALGALLLAGVLGLGYPKLFRWLP